MFILTIKNDDESVYWREEFDTRLALNTWLKYEQSRPYWNKKFKTEVVDRTAEVQAERDKAEAYFQKELVDREAKKKEIRDAIAAKPKTVADCIDLINKLVSYLDL